MENKKFDDPSYGTQLGSSILPIRILSGDEEYVALRDHRNVLRDDPENLRARGCYLAAAAIDPILELYERSKGTEYCQYIYLKLSQYGRK